MTLQEAREHVGSGVVYRAAHDVGLPEDGTITSVNDRFVFVRFGHSSSGLACDPRDLELLR